MTQNRLGGLAAFNRLHARTLATFAQHRKTKHQEDWEFKRESGGSGQVFELIERADREPESLRPSTPMQIWAAARESHAADEFPYLLADSIEKKLYRQMVNWQPVGMMFCGTDEVSKLEVDAPRPFMSQLENLVEIKAGAERPLGQIGENKYNVQVAVNARAWRIEPKVIINDDLGALRNITDMIVLASERSLDVAIATWMKTPGNAYDGVAFFHASAWPTGHANLLTTALTLNGTGGNITLPGARLLMRQQKDIGPVGTGAGATQYLGLKPRYLVTGMTLYDIAAAITTNPQVNNDGGTAVETNRSAVFGLQAVEFDSYPDTNDWFLFPDPSATPVHAIKVAFLNGRTLPTIRAGWHTGGQVLQNYLDDSGLPLYPVHVEVDAKWKVNGADPRGAVKANVTGGT